MFAIVVLIFFIIIYFTVWVTGVYYLRHWKEKQQWGKVKCLKAGLTFFLLIYLPFFWEWLPVKIAYPYYCYKEAGTFQYKTLAQWHAENPGSEHIPPYTESEIESLPYESRFPKRQINGQKAGALVYSPRISLYSYQEKMPLSMRRFVRILFDEKNQEILAKNVGFQAGGAPLYTHGFDWKIWGWERGCESGRTESDSSYFYNLAREFANKRSNTK